VWSCAFSFNFRYPLFFLRSFCSWLRLHPRPPITSALPLYLSFSNVFCKAVPTRDVTNPVSFPSFCYMEDIPVLLYSVILFNYSHDQSNESSSSSSTTFQKFPGIYDLVFVSVFGKRLSGKSNKVVVFHLLSTPQYSSRSNHSGHVCCYTIMNLFEHNLLCALSRYWCRCFGHQTNLYRSSFFLGVSLRLLLAFLKCPAWET
jgi:hypothetical protein